MYKICSILKFLRGDHMAQKANVNVLSDTELVRNSISHSRRFDSFRGDTSPLRTPLCSVFYIHPRE